MLITIILTYALLNIYWNYNFLQIVKHALMLNVDSRKIIQYESYQKQIS